MWESYRGTARRGELRWTGDTLRRARWRRSDEVRNGERVDLPVADSYAPVVNTFEGDMCEIEVAGEDTEYCLRRKRRRVRVKVLSETRSPLVFPSVSML